MKQAFIFFFLFPVVSLFAQSELITHFEKTKGKGTPPYHEGIAYFEKLAATFETINIRELGLTDSGYPLHLLTLDLDQSFEFDKAHQQGKAVILINNGIHPGEPDGIDASMMLLRDLAKDKKKRKVLKNTIIAVIPYYNIGGALNRNSTSRVNQEGPAEYGFRGNAQNLDLNRDFIKMDSENAWSFAQIFHLVKPDVFIDTHVSNGADYQYKITHLATQHNKLGGALGRYIENEMTPSLEKWMKDKGEPITPYVNVFNTSPEEGFSQFIDHPRYSTGYAALFHTLGYMIETHMLKPFDQRVRATYRFLQGMIEIVDRDGEKIKKMRKEAIADYAGKGSKLPVDWQLDQTVFKEFDFMGYQAEMKTSKVTGLPRLFYDQGKPFVSPVKFYNTFKPLKMVTVPKAYIIPAGWHKVIDRLETNGVKMMPFERDTALSVEKYRLKSYDTSPKPYEGHYPHVKVEVGARTAMLRFRKGDYLIPVDQPAARFLIETLEPHAKDSYFAWNFFDTILQQKEGFSPYVFEEIAESLLKKDKSLREKLEKKKQEDQAFNDDGYAQLQFIYRHSPHHEKAFMEYPVYRVPY